MFATSTQPSLVSLFSSTGGDPLQLFSTHTDPGLPSDSFIHLLNDSSSRPEPPSPATLIQPSSLDCKHATTSDSSDDMGYCLDQTVLHIQSPTLPTTYIRCPLISAIDERKDHLGMKHPWINMQVRNLGREWSFEVGLVDQMGRQGVVRCSTFQKQPRLKRPTDRHTLPLLHLPFAFAPPSSHLLTSWSTVALHLPPLLAHFSSLALTITDQDNDDAETEPARDSASASDVAPLPGGIYSHVSYVKVYATCRLRRIWFSDSAPQEKLPWEFQLYAAE